MLGSFGSEDTPERLALESRLADEAIDIASEFIETNRDSWRSMISSLFLARASQALRSCCILSHHGAAGDAMSVGRTVVELDIEHAYILAADTESRWESYVVFEATSINKIVQATNVLHGGQLDAAALNNARQRAQAAREHVGSSRQWAGRDANGAEIDLRARAIAVGRNHQYDIAYRDMCGASHGVLIVHGAHDSPAIAVLLGPGADWIDDDTLAKWLSPHGFSSILILGCDSVSNKFAPSLAKHLPAGSVVRGHKGGDYVITSHFEFDKRTKQPVVTSVKSNLKLKNFKTTGPPVGAPP